MARKTRKLRKSRKARRSRKQRGGDPKTVQKHLIAFEKSKSHPGCFFSANEDNIEKDNKVLIIGPRYPKQTDADYKSAKYPYEECLFFFNMDFPPTYPGVPPHMQFVNSAFYGDNFRYHPNLYERFSDVASNGKVCLSILGTWQGPGWTSDMNIESVLTTVQSLLGPNPIHNEPSFEGLLQDDPRLLAYNHKATYRSIKFTLDTYKRVFEEAEEKLPPNIQPFVEQLKVQAYTAMKFFARKLALLKKQTPKTTFQHEIHHGAMVVDYDSLLTEVLAFLPTIPQEYAVNTAAENTSVKSENDARKQEEAAKTAARLAAMGASGGITAEKYALNQNIKEKEMLIAAMMASGDNARNLERNLKKLRNRRAALNAHLATPASKGTGAAAPAGAPETVNTSIKANNKKPSNTAGANEDEEEEELEYEYESGNE
jgi:ubiquitin-protein ligase/acetolactate synthase small subunit